jgi:molybdate transport system substrate-binding protein
MHFTYGDHMDTIKILTCLILALIGNPIAISAASAADIRVFSSNAMTDSMSELSPAFERASGHKVHATYEPTNLILDRLRRGETADVVILIKPTLQELKQANKIVAGTEADVARTKIGIAVRAGAPRPDISSIDAFKQSMLASKSIVISKVGASGIQFTRALEKLGIYEQLKPRIQILEGSGRTAETVARGGAEIAVQMISELLPIAGVEVLGPLPGELNYEIVLSAALLSAAKESDAASALIRFISAPGAAAILKKKGMEPA